ncbi:hypothetical protein Rhe02_93560 [Rhizocola hellebori]|uniref:Probable cytosol aminopeptidase n=1 Tax=Rhizocola hellebori TaxID=1392758 RepID=A0A8J3VLB1_9ACTN|nr:leucyl aminopeptidase family protein [Rhizocola hellebori]GIH11289.1 hypothetical protein Rhe02_93560 [Rhizocola hellebori]
MISIRLGAPRGADPADVLVIPVQAADQGAAPVGALPEEISAEVSQFITQTAHAGKPGKVEILPRPLRVPTKILVVGVGSGDENSWRAAGAAIARSAAREAEVAVIVSPQLAEHELRGFAEGLWLGEYTYRLRDPKPDQVRLLATVTVAAEPTAALTGVLDRTRVIAARVNFARDLTNTPSQIKTPSWLAEQIKQQVTEGVSYSVRDQAQLAEEGFGGILAVGGGSAHPPLLVQLSWNPPGATEHVVLVGKGITFDTGGVDIKPNDAMQLMRKDMGGAATAVAATLAAAELNLPIRITTLTPLAENMLSGGAWRSGDVVRHYGGLTSEVHSTDAEGRVVMADAMAYAVAHLEPDLLLDLATLTGASRVALGKKTAALFTDSPELLESLTTAAVAAGEQVWQMPLADEYVKDVAAEIADLNNAAGNPGAITAALYLREFAGPLRNKWAHIDMSAPSWSGEVDSELAKGATGWGVRTLVRWLTTRAG